MLQVAQEKDMLCKEAIPAVNRIISDLEDMYREGLLSSDETDSEYSSLIIDIIDKYKTKVNQQNTSDVHYKEEL